MKQTLQNLLAEGKTTQVLAELRQLSVADKELANTILQTAARFAEMENQKHRGTLVYDALTLERNQIIDALLHIIGQLPDNAANEKSALATPESKTVVQNAEKIYNFETIQTANWGKKIDNSEAVVADSKIEAARDVHVGTKQIETNIENQIINYNDCKEIPRLLTNPPFHPNLFIGRENDLNAIETQYQHHNRLLVLVNGEGGIGKTTLAAKYWYAHADRYQHLAWLYADAGIGAALVNLKEPLGVIFGPEDDLEAQVRRMMQAINNLETPCLLVFDNANNDADLKKYYAALNQLPNCHILLTSRVHKLADIKVHKVKPLTEADAVTVFQHHYPDLPDADLPLLHDVLNAVGYNTLVTEVLAKNLAVLNHFTTRYSLADLLKDLQAKGLLALKNKAVEVVYGSDQLREAEPTEIIAAMYDLAKLSDAERHVLSNFAVLPAENIAYELFSILLQAEEDTLEQPLQTLEAKGWLEYRKTDNTFKISPVIQEVTRLKNADRLLNDCRALVDTLKTGLNRDNRHLNNYQLSTAFARLGAAVIHALPIDDDVATLCQNIGDYHKDTGNLHLMLESYQKMLDIQTALCSAEPDNAHFKNGLAISYEKLGEAHSRLGNMEQSLFFFEKRNKLGQELYASNPQNVSFKNGLAISYSKLGDTHSRLGNLGQALFFFEKDIELTQELYASNFQDVSFKNSLAISYERLGDMHSRMGNLEQALGFFEVRNKLGQEIYASDPKNMKFKNGLAISYERLGDIYSRMQNWEKSLGFFEKNIELTKELYVDYPQNVDFKNGLAISYYKLGEISKAKKDHKKAKHYFQEAEKLWLELVRDAPQYVRFQHFLEEVQKDIKSLD
jgi:tetratricopeptide (TPR) repeat protein